MERVYMQYPVSASCQCGQVSYELAVPPQKVIACHCQECQKLSTSPFSVTAVVPQHTIQFTGEMKEWSRIAESGNENRAKFCPQCGTRIYHYNPQSPDIIKLKMKPVGASVDTSFAPTMHIFVSENPSWYLLPKGIISYEKGVIPST
ncbi:GFA family protein [Shewanella psychrophila]